VLTYTSRAEAVLEAAPDAIVGVNPAGVVRVMNARAERLFGYRRDEVIGQSVRMLVPDGLTPDGLTPDGLTPDGLTPDGLVPDRQAPDAGPEPVVMELVGRCKAGNAFPAEVSLAAVHTDEGQMLAAAIRDVSERKSAEAKFRWMIEVAPDAILGVDATGSIELVNARCELLFGFRRAELLGQPVETVIPDGLRPVDAGQVGAGLEVAARHRDGTRIPVEVSLSALETPGGRITMAAVRDISDRRRFEELLSAQNVELERASRAKDNFLSSMNHELRTPLNAIIGFTGTLLMGLPGPLNAEQAHQLRVVQTSGKHLLSIINDLLDLATIESGGVQLALQPVDCLRVAEEVVASLRPLAGAKGIALRIEAADESFLAMADHRALGQILINLVNNAIKFTDCGAVSVSLARPGDGGGVQVAVHDSGPGIPRADLDRIFRAFERSAATAKSTDEGTGLGLHISRKLAQLLDATITVTSSAGLGSTFTLSLTGH
jgi:PAS domain S-box-containing protein